MWGWQTSGPVHTLPLPAEHMVAFGSSDGRVYVVMSDERTTLYRVRTGGAIGEGLADYGTRTLLIPSADYSLYAIDLLTSNPLWMFSSGGVVDQCCWGLPVRRSTASIRPGISPNSTRPQATSAGASSPREPGSWRWEPRGST